MRKLSHEELVHKQALKGALNRLPLVIVLDSIRSVHNVGSIFRTCDGAGVEKLYLCGITAYPPDRQITKTALGAEDRVPWAYHADIRSALIELKAKGYSIVLLEQTDTSVPYEQFKPVTPMCLVVGNEVEGVNDSIFDLADSAIDIDMGGLKISLNVAVACGVVTYHLRHQLA